MYGGQLGNGNKWKLWRRRLWEVHCKKKQKNKKTKKRRRKNQCDEGGVDTEEKGKTGRRRPKWTKSFLANEASK